MKQLLITVFKGFLILTLVVLVLLLVFGLLLLVGWPWWVGIFVLLGLAGVVLAVLVLRKFMSRRREQMFVQQVIAQDESAYQRMAPKEQDAAKELQARWKEAIEALRKSHLRKFGNPLYVLPWYMIIGESGSGKTTAIQSARLSSPFAEVTRTSGISGTRNCDWWFFEQAILIDTAGRYAVPVDAGRDKDEWEKFLNLLARFRKKEPLNGLVVTVAADRLARSTPETLQRDGAGIRQRIDETMRVIGATFPVYVMVTKCDLIQGATQFCDALPEASLNQAMGFLNQKLAGDTHGLLEKVFRTVGDRLRDLRLLLLNQSARASNASAMLLFPEEFEKLKEPLTAFITGAFQENPYQEKALLRGIFFSSGRQEGTPFSHFLNALGLIQNREVLAGTNKGLFLHDLFAKILPHDRQLFRPTQHMAQWNRLTRNMGLTAWIALVVAACGLLSYAFVKNLSTLSDVRREFEKPAILQGELLADVISMDRFRNALLKVEQGNRSWWIPRMGLNTSLDVEQSLKQKFVGLYQRGFLTDFDAAMGQRMTRFSAATPRREFGFHVAHVVRRINLLKARLANRDLNDLSALPQPGYSADLMGRDDVIPEIQAKLGEQYRYALVWQTDTGALNKELTHLQTWLKHMLTLPGVTLNWLVDWVDADPDLASVGMSEFWGVAPDIDQAVISGAFTQKGKERIDAVITEIEAALFDPLIIAAAKIDFGKWYREAYLNAWQEFAREFPRGTKLLKDRQQWQDVARRLPTDKGPYNAFIDRLGSELESYSGDGSIPAWASLVYSWQQVRQKAMASKLADLQKAGLVQKATDKVASTIRQSEYALGLKTRSVLNSESLFAAAKAYQGYQTALEEAVKGADSRNVAFKLAADLYEQDPATGESHFLAAHRALEDIRKQISGRQSEAGAVFWPLVEGNIRFMQHYVTREAACQLQKQWEKDVLLEVQGVSLDKDMTQLMMGSDGFATKFIKGPAAPFLARSLNKGFYAKRALDTEIPFGDDFLSYLNKGARAARPTRSSYAVKIRAYPTDTNQGAQLQPHATVLELQCADNTTRLENLNYPVAKTFVWSPQECGDVTFKIMVGNLVLTTSYTGYNAFAKFLNEFKTGQRVFKRSEFPSEEAALRRIGIQYIKAKYQFQGHEAALQVLYSAPGKPPQSIVACWDQ
jgi:type VI secretion system protein ImpL